MSDSVYKNTSELIRFLLRETDLLRSPLLIFVLIASVTRTAMIYLINEAAEMGGPNLMLIGALIFSAVLMIASTHWAKMSGVRLVESTTLGLRERITQRLLRADVSFFQSRDYGEVFQTSTAHIRELAGAALRLVDFVHAILLLVFCLAYMYFQMPSSIVATLIALALGGSAFFLIEGPARRAVRASHLAMIAFTNSVQDLLRGYKELRLRSARRNALAKRMGSQTSEVHDLTITAERYFSYGQISALSALAILLVSVVAVLPFVVGTDSVTMLQVLTLVLFSFGPIEQMVGGLPAVARATVALRIFKQLDADLMQNPEHQAADLRAQDRPGFETIELRGATVHLSRDVGEDKSVKDTFTLGPIHLTLYPGQSVFITGGNGMGKSTLLQLLTGLRHPDGGQIFLNGEEVTRENVSDYRSVFAAVFSEFYMFRQLYGLSSEERDKLDTHIKEMGLSEGVSIAGDAFANLALSTGQMRRLALSIALAEERPVIVLDEFAADQDPARRAFFYDLLVPRLAAAGHCVVAVTHDEHCFDKADRLIRMADGQIIADTIQNPAKLEA